MQIKMCFFVKNIVLLFLFTPNDPENGKITCHNHLHYVRITFTLVLISLCSNDYYASRTCPYDACSVLGPFRVRSSTVND